MPEKRHITILATGGTISGKTRDSAATGEYVSGLFSVEELLGAVPELAEVANVSTVQVANIGSENMTEDVWLGLADYINSRDGDPSVDGFVVLHGTDTMEETAYFLHLVAKTGKPIVFTGAMRPANAVSADGSGNILSAVQTAVHGNSAGRGVLVVFGSRIFSARDVVKLDAVNLDAFGAPNAGPCGAITRGVPQFHHRPITRHTVDSEFSVPEGDGLPRVEIIYGHAGQRADVASAVLGLDRVEGIVHAGVGAGNIHQSVKPILREAVRNGIPVVASSRVVAGMVPFSAHDAQTDGFVFAGNLNPQKARVLLQLALMKTSDAAELQWMFDTY